MADAELIDRILAGEQHLFARLVERYAGNVWAICWSYVKNRNDCEDVVQNVFVKCYQRLNSLRDHSSFGKWLGTVARRESLMWVRASSRRAAALERYGNIAQHAESKNGEVITGRLQREELYAGIRAVIDVLPPKTREAFLLRYAEGRSVSEAAEFLGITPNAFSKRLEFGRKLLKGAILAGIEPAMSAERHRDDLGRKVMAGIPLVSVSWLTETGTGAALVSQAGLYGGIALMSKKIFIAVGAILFVAGLILLTRADKQEAPQIITREEGIVSKPDDMVQNEKPLVAEAEPETASSPGPASPPPPVPAEEPVPAENVADTQEQVMEVPASTCTVSGSVVDESGNSVPGATVTVIATGVSSEKDDWNSKYKEHSAFYDRGHHFHGTSGPLGKYAIEGITVAGKAIVQAVAGDLKGETNVAFSRAGHCQNVLITISESIILRGRVFTESGVPVTDAVVKVLVLMEPGKQLAGPGEQPLSLAYTDGQGSFELSVHAKGSATIAVMSRIHGFRTFWSVSVDGQQEAELILPKSATIKGRVTRDGGGSVEGSIVALRGSAPAVIVIEGSAGYGSSVEGVAKLASLNREGKFCFENVDPWQLYYIQIREDDGKPVSPNVSLGKLEAGETRIWDHNIEESIVIRGNVHGADSGQPLKDVRIKCRKAGRPPEGGAVVSAEVEDDGSYRLLLNSGEGLYTLTPILTLKPLPEYAAEVSLIPGDEKEIDFTLIEPVTISLRIVDTDGNGIAGAKVGLRVRQKPRPGATAMGGKSQGGQADENGYFHCASFCPDVEYELRLTHPGYSPILLGPYIAGPGDIFEEEVVLSRSAVITGIALYDQGAPIVERSFYASVYDERNQMIHVAIVMTDSNGYFSIGEAVGGRTARLKLATIVNKEVLFQWSSDLVHWPPGETVDLGEIVLQPKKTEAPPAAQSPSERSRSR
ncbi:sigma-70 family RNA polymerase sigma factor [Candidatus Hydrogenedentota bacterium]